MALLAGCGDSGGGETSEEPEPAPDAAVETGSDAAPEGSAEAAPATSAGATPAAPGTFNWTLVDTAALYADDSHALGAASNGDEVLGVGYRTGGGAEEISLAWRTRDGRTWERGENSRSPPAPGSAARTRSPPRRGADGWVVAGMLRGDDPTLAVWVSPDGETWAAVESPAFAAPKGRLGGVTPSGVAASADAIVVGGSAETIDNSAAVPGARPTGAPGSAWTTTTSASPSCATSRRTARASSASAPRSRPELRNEGVVWRSEDGTDWRRVASPALGAGGEDVSLEAVAYGDGRWWIAGHQLIGDPADASSQRAALAMWSSADGETWEREPQDVMPYDLDVEVDDVAALPGGAVVVIGTSTDPSLPQPAAVSWTRAADGTWRQQSGGALQGNGSVTGNGVAALGDVPVALGTTVILDEPGEEDDGGVLNLTTPSRSWAARSPVDARCWFFTLGGGPVRSAGAMLERCARSASSPPTARAADPWSGGCSAGSRRIRLRRRPCRWAPSRCSRLPQRSARARRARSCRSSASRCSWRRPSSPGRRGCRRWWPTSSPRGRCWRRTRAAAGQQVAALAVWVAISLLAAAGAAHIARVALTARLGAAIAAAPDSAAVEAALAELVDGDVVSAALAVADDVRRRWPRSWPTSARPPRGRA